jgi:5-methylcytosine-specific restriction endonuclease McrA
VLVLNRYYMAMHMIPLRHALLLLYRNTAEVIDRENEQYVNYDFTSWCQLSVLQDELGESQSEWIRLVRQRLLIPRIVRLTRFDRVYHQPLRFNRRNLFARDKQRCQYCWKQLTLSQMSLDHVMPRSQGGDTNWENIVCCCVKCNTTKGNRTPKQADMELRQRPRKPALHPQVALEENSAHYSLWKTFLVST